MRFLFAALCVVCTGCTTLPATTVKLYPPSGLLEDCKVGRPLTFRTNKDLEDSVLSLAHALKLCNIDKAALREWSKE